MKQTDIRVIFSDIDGTLLPFGGKDLSVTVKTIEDLTAKGIEFVLCTGRGLKAIPPQLLKARGIRYVISGNGSAVTELATGKVLRERIISHKAAVALVDYIRKSGHYLGGYKNGQPYFDTKRMAAEYEGYYRLKDWVCAAIPTDLKALLGEDECIDKILAFEKDDRILWALIEDMRAFDFGEALNITTSGINDVEINAEGATKGEAAAWLLKRLGISPANMLAAGDSDNDLSMLEMAAVSLVPEDSVPHMLEKAGTIVPSSKENGVERYLRETFL